MNEDKDKNHHGGKWAQISKDYKKQGSVISAGFASKLDSITREYQKLRTVSKKPKTFYIGEDVKHRPSNIYLMELEESRREAELESQAE
jgi:predicted GIY-YIG superfamily endonuclease